MSMKLSMVRILLAWFLVSVASGSPLFAQSNNGDQSLRGKLEQAIEVASGGQLKIQSVKATQLSTIYEVQLNTGEILYSDIAGDYLFAGDMYRTSASGLINVSSSARQSRVIERLAAVPESEMIIFEPEEIKASITVFTDVDCTYCRKLHSEIEKILEYGIKVRYLAYPRGGESADAYEKMISVWCSDNREKSFEQAKNGQNIPGKKCSTPILEHYALGNEFGVNGTPAIVFPDGQLIPGYIEASRLAAMLKI
ncbi:MAG: DsbC family protein [Gammaproteobacteria bacterium]|nr:DsbC family protein [Gammaproteobacteria bacterium]MDB2444523.1 DsbC family protein [Gammaproteobacteria bacterium]MDG0997787.1 DsbC family protein [Gammaproteobacteria bacterium]